MPELQFSCPHCEGLFEVDAALRGTQVLCPFCEQEVPLPDAEEAAPPPLEDAQTSGEGTLLQCPICQGEFLLPEGLAETRISCPHCANELDVGGGSDSSQDPDRSEFKAPSPWESIPEVEEQADAMPPRDEASPAYPPEVEPAAAKPATATAEANTAAEESATAPAPAENRSETPAVVPRPAPVRRHLTPAERDRRRFTKNLILGVICLVTLIAIYFLLI